jgi:hypothetical protein
VLSGGSEALVEVNHVSLTHPSEILAYYPARAPGFLSLHLSKPETAFVHALISVARQEAI